jgi:hypothetical protein
MALALQHISIIHYRLSFANDVFRLSANAQTHNAADVFDPTAQTTCGNSAKELSINNLDI